ncbi:MAG TPA: 2Fe-2S iron-sulfur cluster-binding protein [Puia sp.]|nr:2Fe-2S iron-sulfur cluster-binding protein [Puia sp.]
MKMLSGTKTITIRVIADGEERMLTTYPGEYRSLMMLIYDRVYVDGFGECRGMGRCGTCRVAIDGDPETLTGMDRNEEATLAKEGYVPGEVRLACQVLLDEQLDGRTVRVLFEG